MRRIAALLLLSLGWATVAPAATPLPLELPLPDLAPLIPFVAAPLEKPALTLPELSLPPAPLSLPQIPPPPLLLGLAQKPMAELPEPRRFPPPCIASFLGVPSELLECGRSQFRKEEYDEARASLEGAARGGDRALVREARYWLGETLVRLGQLQAAERNFLLVAQDVSGNELAHYALASLGWIAFRLNDPARARASFDDLLRSRPGLSLLPFARSGRALALFGLTRYSEAKEAWDALLAMPLPQSVRLEAAFWLGETLARLGDPTGAEAELRRFTGSGLSHPLLATAILRLGWWALAAGHPLESVKAYRWFLSAFPRSPELPWARAGLVHALLALDDWSGARTAMEELSAAHPTHDVVLPSLLALGRRAAERKAYADARSIHQELLRRDLPFGIKAHVLFLDGEAFRGEGQLEAARAQYEQVRSGAGGMDLGWRASLRLAQMDLREREFSRMLAEMQTLLRQPLSPELRVAALSLIGDAGYWAKDYETAASAFSRFLSEFPGHSLAADVAMSLGWAEFRQGKLEAARARWMAVARSLPAGDRAGEALLLAAELASEAGDFAAAGHLFDQMLAQYPAHPQREVAVLNRAIVRLHDRRFEEAAAGLNDLIKRSPLSPFLGRIGTVHGGVLLALNRPREAAREFMAALQQGEGALAHIGLGSAALAQRQWAEATQHFGEARDSGTEPVRQAALYGLAVTALHQGSRQEFIQQAALLQQAPGAPPNPRLLYVLAALAVEDKGWERARDLTLRLVRDHAEAEEANHSLFRLGTGAGAAGQWGLAREAWELLITRDPQSPFGEDAGLGLGEALFRLGAAAEARKLLEKAATTLSADPRLPRILFLLAQSREATGDRTGAVQVYDRMTRDFPDTDLALLARLGQGRLLQREGEWKKSRQLLEAVLTANDQAASVEAAYHLGEGFRARGDHEAALEAFMSAAYMDPASPWGRKALSGAGQSFSALKDPGSAAVVYRKLLAQPGIEPELAGAAKQALQRLGQSP
jgi:TolA-binding protein